MRQREEFARFQRLEAERARTRRSITTRRWRTGRFCSARRGVVPGLLARRGGAQTLVFSIDTGKNRLRTRHNVPFANTIKKTEKFKRDAQEKKKNAKRRAAKSQTARTPVLRRSPGNVQTVSNGQNSERSTGNPRLFGARPARIAGPPQPFPTVKLRTLARDARR